MFPKSSDDFEYFSIRSLKVKLLLALAVLLSWGVYGSPVFAEGPSGKHDSPVSPLLQQFIEQLESGVDRNTPQLRGDAATPYADFGAYERASFEQPSPEAKSTESESTDDPVRFDSSGRVQVYIHVANAGDETLQQLRDLGAEIEITNTDLNLVQAWVPSTAIEEIALLETVERITPPSYAQTRAGSVTSGGDSAHHADLVRALTGLTGKGVKVGVISDGIDSYLTSVSSGDLPSNIEVNPNNSGRGDEGTALLEIVHDLAPGADLAFSKWGTRTSLDMVGSILWLDLHPGSWTSQSASFVG